MKLIYCCSSDNIQKLKTMPGDYTSSKINTLFTKTEPIFTKEFLSISNIEYIKIKNYPDYHRFWDDMMNKITFAYNLRYLESKILFEEYVSFNKKYAEEINSICENDNLVVVNDSSLYLIPGMVRCKVAIRNIVFDECFIERVPYYREVLEQLFKAEKFFGSGVCKDSFLRYLQTSYVFAGADIGGCYYMKSHVDKEAVLDVLRVCHAYIRSLKLKERLKNNGLLEHLRTFSIPKENEVILTNVPLLHLEVYIKKHPGANVRYIRALVEIDEKQGQMVQYLKKTYNSKIDVIDKHDYDVIVLEMLYCSIFIGSKHEELAKLLRKPFLPDNPDPIHLCKEIEEMVGKVQEKQSVCSEDAYLQEFLGINGCDMHIEVDDSIDSRVDRLLAGLEKCFVNGAASSDEGECDCASEKCTTECLEKMASRCTRPSSGQTTSSAKGIRQEDILYEKTVNDAQVLYKRPSDRKTSNCVVQRKETVSLRASKGVSRADPAEDGRRRKPMHEPELLDTSRAKEFWRSSHRVALFDYDGTLSRIEKLPHLAAPKEALFDILDRFSENARLVICTGRSVETVDEWFPSRYEIFAEHGAAHRKDGKWTYKDSIKGIEECLDVMEYYQIRKPGSVVERKRCGCAFHYKLVKDFDIEKLNYLLRRVVGDAVVVGKNVIEVRSSNKYEITRQVKPTIVAGDDVVDEDLYDGCDGVSIRVGEGITKADYYVRDVPELLDFLDSLNK